MPSSRVVLTALLVAPAGVVLVTANVLRDLVFVIPATRLTSIGLIAGLEWLTKRLTYNALAPGSFTILTTMNFAMRYDATVNGPTWYNAYGLTGLQYGGQAVFEEARN